MRRSILIFQLLFFLISFTLLNAQWAITYGGSGSDYPWCIQQTSDGGYVIAGDTYSFGAGDCNCWILKVTSTGDIEWQKIYGGSDDDSARFIQQTTDGGYIVAAYTYSFGFEEGNFWVLKLDATGSIEWQKTYGGQDADGANCICQTTDGGYIVAGGSYSFGSGSDDAWILKLSSTGIIEWQKTYGGSEIDSAGSIRQTNDGGYIVGGCTESFGAGNYDAWIFKLSSTGTIEWQKTYGGYKNEGNVSYKAFIEPATDGGYVVTTFTWSFTSGYSDVWVFKISSTGSIEWQNSYGSWSNYDTPYLVRQTADGGYIVAGFTYSFGAGMNDVWVVKLSSAGGIEWQKTYGGLDYDYGRFIQQTADGGYIVAAGTRSFGAGSADILLLKLYPDGEIVSSCELTGVSTASIIPSMAYVQDSSANSGNSDIIPSNTSAIPQDTDASANVLCEASRYVLTIFATSGGTTEPAPNSYEHNENSQVLIEAIPNSGYRFTGWSGDATSTDNPVTVTMDSDKSLTANFAWEYFLTITAGEGGTTSPLPGSHGYGEGSTVVITAVPNTDYGFIGWTGDVPSGHETDNPVAITMGSDKSITAHFIRTFQLIIAVGKGGTTDPEAGTHVYYSGMKVTITAIPNENFEFKGWSIGASSTENPLTVTMDKDKYIVASFSKIGEADKSFWELDCFIATAAYGSPLHPYVKILREFRDKYLMTSGIGQKLVSFYYKHSPFMAGVIAKHRVLKSVVCYCLLPLVVFSYSMLCAGPGLTIVLFSIMLFLPVFFMVNDLRKNRYHKIEPKNHRSL